MGTTKRSFPYEKICEGIKMIYKNKFGEVDILNKKYDFNNKIIGLSMSGGADSTMLCYLLAKTIQEEKLNIIIQPYNGYDIDVSGDSEKLPNIIEYIRNKFPDIKIRWPIAVTFKSNGKDVKMNYIEILESKLKECKVFDVQLVAVSQGPPLEVQQNFKTVIDEQSNQKKEIINENFRICPSCNQKGLKTENGCDVCIVCGYSKCDK